MKEYFEKLIERKKKKEHMAYHHIMLNKVLQYAAKSGRI